MAKKKQVKPVGTATNGKPPDDQAVALAKYATIAYIDADEWGIKNKAIEQFPLDGDERATLAALPVIPAVFKKKLGKKAALTVVDVISLVVVISESLVDAEAGRQAALLGIAKKLKNCLQENIARPSKPGTTKMARSTGTVYQLKITLKESQPPIWRRIQVKDCTLDKLHEHIQTAMGWTNSHLHHFEVEKQLYGDPMLIGDNFDDMEYEDSTATNLSDIIPENRRKFRFDYEYDFGDSWHHEILWEGCPKEEPGKKYPLCLEGERGCPPEDCGGIWGYPDFVQAIDNPNHERHKELLEWIGSSFDPEAFDPAAATKAMKNWLRD
jgi:Plasmid pRiA4b ORF-3-like protein